MTVVQRADSGSAGQGPSLFLIGPLRLSDPTGCDLTPGSGVQRAMLAVLALAPRGAVSRARLQDLFWGAKDPQRAAQSLRTALHGLRRSLAAIVPALLESDDTAVRLRLDLLWVDLLRLEVAVAALHGTNPEVLEGMNPRIEGGAEVFEDWLRETRSYWGDRIEALRAAPRA